VTTELVLVAFGIVGLIGGVPAGFFLGGRKRRIVFLVAGGIVAWLAWTVSWYGVGCSPNSEDCTAALVGLVAGVLGLAALLGWLIGIGVGRVGRIARSRARR